MYRKNSDSSKITFFHSHLFEILLETVFTVTMLQREHSGLKPKEKKDALPFSQVYQMSKPDIRGTIVTKHQKHLNKASSH